MEYQPKTGEKCSCKPGMQRDNCPQCEGTGERVDFKKIRAATCRNEWIQHKDYIDGKRTHREYMGQFVTPYVRERVLEAIGIDRIQSSPDEHFNDIPLAEWDKLAPRINGHCAHWLRECGDSPVFPGVCIAKEAARQLKADVADVGRKADL